MALFMVKTWMGNKNPDDYFDPVTHIATESNFIEFLRCGVYDSKYIGYKVQLANSSTYNNGLWVIADVNHDSTNTGQTNCYDLISEDLVYGGSGFGGSYVYRNSTIRTTINGTLYNGFSNNFKERMLNIKYKSAGSWYSDDKMLILSGTELNGVASQMPIEGLKYPIFTGESGVGLNSSRVKYYNGSALTWFTRSKNTSNNGLWIVGGDGSMAGSASYSDNRGDAVVMRVQ